MKKIFIPLLAVVMMFGVGCSSGTGTQDTKSDVLATEADKSENVLDPKPVEASWFDDAVFVGDSVTLKLNYFCEANPEALGKAQFFCAGSLGYASALWELDREDAVHPYYKGENHLVEDCVQLTGAIKVFVMLGMNDIGLNGVDGAMESARQLIGNLRAKSDGAQLYIQSVTPIMEGHEYDDLNNELIRSFNEKLLSFCEKENYRYMDIYSLMADKDGFLRADYCGDEEAQGIHFTDMACSIWANYLKENV